MYKGVWLCCPGNRVIKVTEVFMSHGVLCGDASLRIWDEVVPEEVDAGGGERGDNH